MHCGRGQALSYGFFHDHKIQTTCSLRTICKGYKKHTRGTPVTTGNLHSSKIIVVNILIPSLLHTF